jgi:hypothetical protein
VDYLHRILPLGFFSAATLALGNVAYLYLDVGLLQMLKSCCPIFVLLVAISFRLEHFSLPLVFSIVLIAAGTATTAATGVSAISRLGLIIQFSSELAEAFRLCLAQLLMCNMKLHPFEALKYMSSACVFFLSVGVWLLEWRRFLAARAWQRVMLHPHWYLAAGLLLALTRLLWRPNSVLVAIGSPLHYNWTCLFVAEFSELCVSSIHNILCAIRKVSKGISADL